jgi:hypothetical protein
MTRSVRRAFLLKEGDHNSMEWLESRLEELAEVSKLVDRSTVGTLTHARSAPLTLGDHPVVIEISSRP